MSYLTLALLFGLCHRINFGSLSVKHIAPSRFYNNEPFLLLLYNNNSHHMHICRTLICSNNKINKYYITSLYKLLITDLKDSKNTNKEEEIIMRHLLYALYIVMYQYVCITLWRTLDSSTTVFRYSYHEKLLPTV